MATTTAELPRWDLESVFPGVDSPELERELAAVVAHFGGWATGLDAAKMVFAGGQTAETPESAAA